MGRAVTTLAGLILAGVLTVFLAVGIALAVAPAPCRVLASIELAAPQPNIPEGKEMIETDEPEVATSGAGFAGTDSPNRCKSSAANAPPRRARSERRCGD